MVDVIEHRIFDPGVRSSTAVLQDAPQLWSYSSLKEIELCPRLYVLSHAYYPELWDGHGYPEAPNSASMFGDVVHDSLERIIRALVNKGCMSTIGAEAVAVMRELGGFSEIIKTMLTRRLAKIDGNPRVDGPRRDRLKDQLEHRIPEAREEVQRYLQRMKLMPIETEGLGGGGGRSRYARNGGSYTEATLQIDALRVFGRVDVLTVGAESVDITDYKTGIEDESHIDQLLFYAVLWDQDEVSNANKVPLGRLTLSYPNREISIDAPEVDELRAMVNAIGPRVAAADELVNASEAAANTGEHCGFCPVRTLCSAYWSITPDPALLEDGAWFDIEGVVRERGGLKHWWLQYSGRRSGTLLLRTTSAHQAFVTGQRIRLLGLRRDVDPDSDAIVATSTQYSEVFLITGESDY